MSIESSGSFFVPASIHWQAHTSYFVAKAHCLSPCRRAIPGFPNELPCPLNEMLILEETRAVWDSQAVECLTFLDYSELWYHPLMGTNTHQNGDHLESDNPALYSSCSSRNQEDDAHCIDWGTLMWLIRWIRRKILFWFGAADAPFLWIYSTVYLVVRRLLAIWSRASTC